MCVNLVVVVWTARYLGPESFGLLTFVLAFSGILMAISSLGLKDIVVRDIVQDPDVAQVTLGTAALLQLIAGVFAYALMICAIYFTRQDDASAYILATILGAVFMVKFTDVVLYWFESQVQSKYSVWVQNSSFLAFAMIKIVLILNQATLVAFAWAMLIEAIIVAIFLLILMEQKGIPCAHLKVSFTRAIALIKDSWALIISAVAITLYMRIDEIMIGQMISQEALGIYSAAVRISEVWYFIPMTICVSVFPALLETKKSSETEFNAQLQKLFDLMVIISLSVALPMTFLAKYIIDLLYGASYLGSGPILALHIWASVFVFLGVANSSWFIAENRQTLSMQRTVLGAVVNVGLNFWLIPIYGPTGAAVATVVSYCVAAFLTDIFQSETRHLFIMKLSSLSLVKMLKRGERQS